MAASAVHAEMKGRARLLGGGAEVEGAPAELDALAGALVDGEVGTNRVGMLDAEPREAEVVTDLLVGRGREDHVPRGLEPVAGERGDRNRVRRDLALHVERAAPPHLPVAELARPRVDLPLGRVREHRVRVREEEEPRPLAAARYPRHEVGALGNPRVELARHPVLLQVRAQVLGRDGLVSGRIHGVEPDESLQEARHLVAKRHGRHQRRRPRTST